MPIMTWNEGMQVGVRLIDDDHKYLVDKMNETFDAVSAGHGGLVLGEMIRNMVAFCVYHFEHEERLFCQTDYPDAEIHKQVHAEIKGKAYKIMEQYAYGPSEQLVEELVVFMKDLIMNHAQTIDRGYVPYLQEKGFN